MTKAAFQVQVPVLGGIVVPSPLLAVHQVEGSRGVSRFRLDIRDNPPAVDGRIVHTADRYEHPRWRESPVSAVVIVIVPPEGCWQCR